MNRKQTTENESTFRSIRRGLLLATAASAGLVVLLWSAIQLEDFLIRDPHFTLAAPSEEGEQSPAMQIHGVKHSAAGNISNIFLRDFGRSLYLIPLRQRRDEILRLPWIKSAVVTRVWPNRIQVRVEEREPVAFLHLPGEDALPLVDADGHILLQETKENLKLPVLTGVTRQQTAGERMVRVRKLVKLIRDADELSAKISEVDAADPDNLKVMQEAGGKAVTLILGNRYFKRRLEKFRRNADDLLRRDPDKTTFDLRVDGSIFARPSQTALAAEGIQPIEQ